jgi:HK97 family phage portal protein
MGLLTRILRPLARELAAVTKDTRITPNSPTLKKVFGWSDDEEIRDPYGQLPIIFASIRAVGRVLSNTRLMVMRGEEEVGENDVVRKLFDNPNPRQSPYELKDSIATNLQTKGNAFLVLSEEMARGVPAFVWGWPASYFKPSYNRDGEWIGWDVKRGQGQPVFYPPERVVHIAGYNPNDELLGLAPLDVLKMAYKTIWDALVYNKKFFENDGTPPIIYKAANILPPEYREAFKKDAIERRKGKKHAHEAQLIEGMDVTTLGFTQKDIQFLELLKKYEEDVLMVFGVTKTQVSKYEDVNYATALSQDKVFISNTCIPIMRMIESDINAQWLDKIGYQVKFDERSNEAMTYLAADEAMKVVSIAHEKLVTVNEARGMLGLEPVEWGDDPPDTTGPVPEQLQPFVGPQDKKKPELPTPEEPETKGLLEDAIGKARRTNTWNALNNRIQPVETRCAKAVRKYFFDIERKVLGNVSKGIGDVVAKNADPNIDLLFSDEKLYHILRTYLGRSIGIGYDTMGVSAINIDDPGVQQYLADRVKYMKGVNDNARDALKEKLHETLADALENKLTEEQTTEAVRNLIKESFSSLKSHARTIARTEVHGAFAEGRWKACEEVEPTEIEWISSRDVFVRDSHQNLDGRRVRYGERFENGCLYPLDPAGGPAEVCNCRCNFQVHF